MLGARQGISVQEPSIEPCSLMDKVGVCPEASHRTMLAAEFEFFIHIPGYLRNYTSYSQFLNRFKLLETPRLNHLSLFIKYIFNMTLSQIFNNEITFYLKTF
jgi:hypothetical protein